MVAGNFPSSRLRRNRKSAWSRNMVRENSLTVNDLIWPIFIQEGKNTSTKIASMPDVSRLTIDLVIENAAMAKDLGIPSIALFPQIPEELKFDDGREAINPETFNGNL